MRIESGRMLNDYIQPNKKQYCIPVFQRDYAWTSEQCEKLFEDIVLAFKKDREHFCGSFVYAPLPTRKHIDRYIIIDGQQRFTTLYILIKALADSATDESDKAELEKYLYNEDKFNRYGLDDKSKLKLKPVKTDNDQLQLLMAGKLDKMNKGKDGIIYHNYMLFRELIATFLAEDPDNSIIGAKTVTAYSGVRLALLFDNKYSYLTLVPSFMYADDAVLTREGKKQFADWFNARVNNGRPNQNANEYIRKWVRKVIGNKRFSANYPLGSTTNFTFSIVNSSALVGVNFGKQASIQLPVTISPKRIIFSGIEYRDPTLRFCGTSMRGVAEDFHPMRGLILNAPVDYAMNNSVLHSAISVGVVCPDEHNQKFAQFISGLNRQSQAKHNTDYLISFPGFYQAFKTGLDLPDPTSSKWKQITASSERDVHKAAVEFGDSIIRKIDQLSANSIDVILIYIPEEYEVFTSYTDGTINYDLHDYIKAYAAQKQVATQFVREKTIESDLHCQIMWALSLALYVKSGRTPWVVNGIQPDTAFAGIGYSVMNGPSGSNVVVGCSHIYSSDGRGMKYKLSKIQDYSFDRKKNPYLSEEEAYRIGLNIKELFYKSFSELPKRVVIHKRTPFRREEVKGLVESLSSAGVKNIELLEITYEDNLKCFALNERCTQVDGYPVRRGMCFPIDKNTMYLFTHGIAPSVISPKRRYFQGGKSVPLPLKVVKHYGSGDMAQIATEILGLSKMNWNSFGLYSKLPCTIESSNEIARIGWLLSQFEGTLYDYRYFM